MHKIIVIILSSSILIQSFNFELMDINKVPTLVNHITTHLEAGDSLSDFLTKHYGSGLKAHKNEHKEHKKLPFKQQHLETQFQYVYALFQAYEFVSFKNIFLKENKFSYKEPTSNSFVNRFFQPPQK